MSIDMEQFHDVFFDESQEHLDSMEQQLMDLNLISLMQSNLIVFSVPPIPLRVAVACLALMH